MDTPTPKGHFLRRKCHHVPGRGNPLEELGTEELHWLFPAYGEHFDATKNQRHLSVAADAADEVVSAT